MIVEALLFLVTIFIILWLYFEAPIRKIKKQLAPIPGPPALPITGNILDVRREEKGSMAFITKSIKKYGNVTKVQFPGRIAVLLTNPEDAELILKSNDLLDKAPIAVEFLKPWLGEGLVTSGGAHWKEHRKLITPTFHFNILEKFFEVFREQTNVLIDILKTKTNQDIDIFPLLQLFALDVICETAMGTKIEAQTKLEGNEYVRAVKTVMKCFWDRLMSVILSIPFVYPLTPTGRREREALKVLKSTVDKIIQSRHNQLRKEAASDVTNDLGEKKRVVFLDLLLQARHTDGTPLSNQEIADEVETFMFAGHDTTSTQMSFLLYLLSKEPEVQEKLYKEQCEIMGAEKRNPTFHDVQNMNYLERTIKEAQRMLGSVSGVTRLLSHDLQLKTNGYYIPKGTHVTIFSHGIHHNPDVYPDPEKFDPDRFLPENVRARNAFAFVPFSAGPRNCIGQKFAMLEMKTCVSNIIRHFKILPVYDSNGKIFEPDTRMMIVLTSINGVYIRLSPRD